MVLKMKETCNSLISAMRVFSDIPMCEFSVVRRFPTMCFELPHYRALDMVVWLVKVGKNDTHQFGRNVRLHLRCIIFGHYT
jgi:hypothetical protein